MAAKAVVFPAQGPPVSRMRVTLTLSSLREPLLWRFGCETIGVDMCFKWFCVEVTTDKDNHLVNYFVAFLMNDL